MREYDPGKYQLRFIWSLNGSVIPRACAYAIPSGLLAVLFKVLQMESIIPEQAFEILSNNAAYAGFSFVVGFLLVFRTSQAYNRFWDGATKVQQMQSKWCDACGSLVAFSRKSKKPPEQVQNFQHVLIRLFSLLHSLALQQIHSLHDETFEVIDLQGLDEESRDSLREASAVSRVELVSSWIHQLIVDNIDTGIMPAPPPIQSRVFQEMSNGSINMNNAYKIAKTPFPFPYAQMTTVLLLAHWILTPALMCSWTNHWIWAFIWTFTPVLSFWCIDLIAVEIEMPFGDDINDLPTHDLQSSMNETLLLLIDPKAGRVPTLAKSAILDLAELEYTYVECVHHHEGGIPSRPIDKKHLKEKGDRVSMVSKTKEWNHPSHENSMRESLDDVYVSEKKSSPQKTIHEENKHVNTVAKSGKSAEAKVAPAAAQPSTEAPKSAPAASQATVAGPKEEITSKALGPPPEISDVGTLDRKDASLRLQECNLDALQKISQQLEGCSNEGVQIMRAMLSVLEDVTTGLGNATSLPQSGHPPQPEYSLFSCARPACVERI